MVLPRGRRRSKSPGNSSGKVWTHSTREPRWTISFSDLAPMWTWSSKRRIGHRRHHALRCGCRWWIQADGGVWLEPLPPARRTLQLQHFSTLKKIPTIVSCCLSFADQADRKDWRRALVVWHYYVHLLCCNSYFDGHTRHAPCSMHCFTHKNDVTSLVDITDHQGAKPLGALSPSKQRARRAAHEWSKPGFESIALYYTKREKPMAHQSANG